MAWLTLRQVRAALANGQLDEAQRLLADPAVKGHQKSWALLEQLTRGLIARAERRLIQGDAAGAWADLAKAEAAAPADLSEQTSKLRQALGAQSLTQARVLLETGDPRRAAESIGRLRERQFNPADWHAIEDAAKDWMLSQELADRGEFALAKQMFERVARAEVTGAAVANFQTELDHRGSKFNDLLPQLHDALDQRRWRDVLQLADGVLAVAPQHGEARKARVKAWKTSGQETIAGAFGPEHDTTPESVGPPKKYHLWIDGVGGYLVCLAPRVCLGQASAEGGVDVPLLADVSRFHASILRDNEGYIIEAARPLLVNGESTQKTTLHPGDRLTLGAACQFIFQRPVPVSATAKLQMQSGQRLPLSLDGILLMAETIVIGPGPQAHVSCDLDKPVVLFRAKDGLGVRYGGDFMVDGNKVRDRANLGPTATITGPDFNFALEPAKNMKRGHA
jgi:hypothetical protein